MPRLIRVWVRRTALLALLLSPACSESSPPARAVAPATPTDTRVSEKEMNLQTATFGAGCFWGAEETFRQVEGVVWTAVGFTGGSVEKPSYEEVCDKQTGHAEVVQVEFDPALVSYDKLLKVFWECHDPTTLNRQGPDVGEQYRSVVFYHTPQQQAAAQASKDNLQRSGKYKNPVVTEISPAGPFNRAEEYHQQYLFKRGKTSCASTIRN